MRQSALLRSGAVLLLLLAPLVVWVTMPVMGQQRGARQHASDRVAGTVTSINETALTAHPLPGWSGGSASVTVSLDEGTRYGLLGDAGETDLARGAIAVALYEGDGDGAVARGLTVHAGGNSENERVTAATVLAMEMLLRERPGGDNDRPALLKQAVGPIRSADSGSLVIADANADIALRLAGNTLLRRLADRQRTDVKVEAIVAIMLPADRDDSAPRLAKAVIYLPPSLLPRTAQSRGDLRPTPALLRSAQLSPTMQRCRVAVIGAGRRWRRMVGADRGTAMDAWEALREEMADIAAVLSGLDWQSVHPDLLAVHDSAPYALEPNAFRYFLPAWLVADLTGTGGETNMVFHLTNGLTNAPREPWDLGAIDWRAYRLERLSALARDEREAVVAYLRYKAAHDDHDGPAIEEALASYWLPSLSAGD